MIVDGLVMGPSSETLHSNGLSRCTNGRPAPATVLLRVDQTDLLTPQKNGSGPCTMPVTFLRHAWRCRKKPSGA
jgi:hypothetical protein